MLKPRTVKRGAAERRPGRSEILRVRLSTSEILLLRHMARRADLTDVAFVRRMLEVHARIEAEILRQAAERAAAEERALVAAVERDEAAARTTEAA